MLIDSRIRWLLDGVIPQQKQINDMSLINKNLSWPKISIITVCFNAAKYLEKAILSVLNQNYPNLEYIICDGGSTDGSVEILKKYDKFINWRSEKDSGQTNALNKGISISSGEILGWLNADEEYLPGTLKKVGELFMTDSELDLIFGDRIKIDVDRKCVALERLPAMHPKFLMLYAYGLLFSDTTFWSRKIQEKTGILDEIHYPHLAMDYDWFLRLSLNVEKWRKIDAYFSLFIERADRKTRIASPKECSGKWIRDKIIRDLKISKIKLLFCWIYYTLAKRVQTTGVKGLFWFPRLSTMMRILGYTD